MLYVIVKIWRMRERWNCVKAGSLTDPRLLSMSMGVYDLMTSRPMLAIGTRSRVHTLAVISGAAQVHTIRDILGTNI